MRDIDSYIEKFRRELDIESKNPLEGLSEFFTARVESYENHMLGFFRETYARFANLIPKKTVDMLDLGCGTGFELDEISKVLLKVRVTGVDVTDSMLEVLSMEHSDKNHNIIQGDFMEVLLGTDVFDTAISFEALHHFTADQKKHIYRKVCNALKSGGCYIECDYVAECEEKATAIWVAAKGCEVD